LASLDPARPMSRPAMRRRQVRDRPHNQQGRAGSGVRQAVTRAAMHARK
jgi:hypothetical protein